MHASINLKIAGNTFFNIQNKIMAYVRNEDRVEVLKTSKRKFEIFLPNREFSNFLLIKWSII